jgi:hypothetical protein
MKRKHAILALIVLALTTAFAGSARVEARSQMGVAESKERLSALLPEKRAMKGWSITLGPKFFEPQNLWEYINGQAEMYIDYGFELVGTAEYGSLDGPGSVTIEIYQMQSPKHAFGIYAAERSPLDTSIGMGVQGYLSENVLNFWKGPYYIKLTSFQRSPETKETLMALAVGIDHKIDGSYAEPKPFACFPEDNRVSMSERFIPRNFLGLSFLKDGYRVSYQTREQSFQAFLVKTESKGMAKEVFRKYQDFLQSEHAHVSLSTEGDYQLMVSKKEKGQAVFHHGPFVGGVLNAADLSQAQEILSEIIRNLRRGCAQ